jgi:hypothetical protein
MSKPGGPWNDPQAEDVCVALGGRTRTVRQVEHGDWAGLKFPMRVAYVTEKDGLRTCEATTWASWCRRYGIAYLRGSVDLLQQAAEDALASGEDHL